ncbi:MAG TPA: glycosyltransferase 87 family protein [Gaiellaceae bacterium]
MSTSEERCSRPAERRQALAAALAAVALFGAAWALLHHGFYASDEIVDTPTYLSYGDAIRNGSVPYRDFALEYPPAALPIFLLPALGDHGHELAYRRSFERLMGLCGLLLVAGCALALVALRARPERLAAALAFTALAPLALGSVLLTRFDLWPAALAVLGLAALLWGRHRLGLGVLGLGAAAKLFPALLVPPALVYVWRRRGRREALVGAAVFAAVVAACFLPFLALSPGGVWESLRRQVERPLQLESLGSGVLLVAHQLFGAAVQIETSHGSQNQSGALPHALAEIQAVLQLAAVAALWLAFARGPASSERLVRYSAACLAAFIAFGKVLSPQFLIWLVPLVPLVRGRRGLLASGLLGLALLLTQLWFPYRYWALAVDLDGTASWLVLARDLLLVALAAVLAMPRREPVRSS